MSAPSDHQLNYSVVSLSSLADNKYELLRNRVMERLGEFKCARSTHLQQYARQNVTKWEKHGHSRTYVFIAPLGDSDIVVPAFFAVGMNMMDLSEADRSVKKKISGAISQLQTGAFCITEFARSDEFSSAQLPGHVILDEARNVICEARKYVGGRYLVVDSQRDVFEKFYSKHGFREIGLAQQPAGMEDSDFVTSCCVIKDW